MKLIADGPSKAFALAQNSSRRIKKKKKKNTINTSFLAWRYVLAWMSNNKATFCSASRGSGVIWEVKG